MATPFLKSVAEYIHSNYKDKVENLCIVLPNRRGALFLKQYLAQVFAKTIWVPTIISAEDFINEISGLKPIDEIDLICQLYESYRDCYGEKAEPFDSFSKWGQLILQDFNEIDRYLADSEQLYENLRDIKVIENWSLGNETLSEFQKDYIEFMASLGAIYKHFTASLIKNGYAYQGLAYKTAVANISSSAFPSGFHKVLFCGFNALNAAELKIFGHLLQQKTADVLWDYDEYYFENPMHEAGLFLRKNFELFNQRDVVFRGQHFREPKEIEVISVPKQIGQSQVVRQCVQGYIDRNIPLDKVAIVLANEKLLWPVLQQLPPDVQHVNITMEYPLRYTSTYALVDVLLQVQSGFQKQNRREKYIYYRDFITLLRQPLFNSYLEAMNADVDIQKIIQDLNSRNIAFVTQKYLREYFPGNLSVVFPLVSEAKDIFSLSQFLENLLAVLQEYFVKNKNGDRVSLELEYLEIFIRNFHRLQEVLIKHPHFNNLKAFRQLFSQVVGNGTASFIGEPLRGLQVMGVLETRTLDFDYLVIVNVNEGVLPSGKSINSFIPNDLKRAFGLPLYLEKDAIYSYHFYRLLQRASEVTITYDSETDTFGKGEKSRFITQLQLELTNYNPNINITEKVAGTSNVPPALKNIIDIEKTTSSLERIIKKAKDDGTYGGLSPSSIIVMKECGLKFYFRYGAGLKELKTVEESAESNTFGSILHLSLETLYKDFVGGEIPAVGLANQLKKVKDIVAGSFRQYFDTAELAGKNVLQEEVLKVYVEKLVRNDLKAIERLTVEHKKLELLALEREFTSSLQITIEGKKETIFIKGKMDRVDVFDNYVRIIDYKNSIKSTDKFTFGGFEDLFNNKNCNKQLQLITYAWLAYKNALCAPGQLRPGIIPFREFLDEPKIISLGKQPLVFSKEFLQEFESHLVSFIERIFALDLAFSQTPDHEICEYCPYNTICNR